MAGNRRTLNENQGDEIAALLVGRRVVSAETGSFDVGRYAKAQGRLGLDDGTTVYVVPNDGGCVCGAGDYELTHLATVDNVITAARVVDEPMDGDYEEARRYQIFVFADAADFNLVTVEGDDGNGYYGTGFELVVDHRA